MPDNRQLPLFIDTTMTTGSSGITPVIYPVINPPSPEDGVRIISHEVNIVGARIYEEMTHNFRLVDDRITLLDARISSLVDTLSVLTHDIARLLEGPEEATHGT